MTITPHTPDGRSLTCSLPYHDAGAATVSGLTCPGCGLPARARCRSHTEDDSGMVGPAECVGCGAALGMLEVEVSTLFGLEADRAVGAGPWRVF